jgi:multiple sugar transport system substrate-binding protein
MWPCIAIMIVTVLGTGCRREEDGTVVEFWAMGRESEVVQQLVPEFERRQPGVRIRVQQIPWSAAHEKLLTAYVGDAMPDVVQVGVTWLPELVALGALAPVDAGVAGAAAGDDEYPGRDGSTAGLGVSVGFAW